MKSNVFIINIPDFEKFRAYLKDAVSFVFALIGLFSMKISPFESRNFQIVFSIAFFDRSAKSLIFDGKNIK
jgi:hypothetical protein